MSNFTREDYIYYARLAEQGERYEDMIRYMKEVSKVSAPNSIQMPQTFNTLLLKIIFIEWPRTFK